MKEDGGSALLFAKSSHRDFAFPFWWDPREVDCSERTYYLFSYFSFAYKY